MSYPDVIKAGDLRQGDRIHNERGETPEVLATCLPRYGSFIGFLVEGEQAPRSEPIGHAMQVIRKSA